MSDRTEGDGKGPTDEAIRELLLAEAHREHVEQRRRRSDLRRQADESRTIQEVLSALVGTGAAVTVHTAAGSLPAAVVTETGRDYVAVRDHDQVRVVPLGAVLAVQAPDALAPPIVAGWARPPAATLDERLSELARVRPRVRVTAGALRTEGRLRSASHDVLVVAGADGAETYLATASLTELALDG